MSKPSASGRPRSFTPGYHRRNLGGGNALKAVTQARRAAASRQIGQGLINEAARERRALAQLLRVAEELGEQEAA